MDDGAEDFGGDASYFFDAPIHAFFALGELVVEAGSSVLQLNHTGVHSTDSAVGEGEVRGTADFEALGLEAC